MIEFFVKNVRVGRDGLGPVFEGTDHTKLMLKRLVTIVVEVLISVCVLFLYTLNESLPSTFLWMRVSNMAI